jgi:hypothetical protein
MTTIKCAPAVPVDIPYWVVREYLEKAHSFIHSGRNDPAHKACPACPRAAMLF